jgi:hypothetical protein
VGAGPIVDTDQDGIIDELDNCKDSNNPTQFDADLDGYGNLCDPDFDNDMTILVPDYAYLGANWGSGDPLADLDGDGSVLVPDYAILGKLWGGNPGPSGLICAGTPACAGITPP